MRIVVVISIIFVSLPLAAMERAFKIAGQPRALWIQPAHWEIKEKLAAKGNIYNPWPMSNDEPLEASKVVNAYWHNMREMAPEKINAEFVEILNTNFGGSYAVWRYNVAGALYVGADANSKPSDALYYPLHQAAYKQDYALCKLLFEKGARIENVPHNPLFVIKNCMLAQLFLDHGADIKKQGSDAELGGCVLHKVAMCPEYEALLIDFYAQRDRSLVFDQDMHGDTPLHILSFHGSSTPDMLVDKAHALMHNLEPDDVIALLSIRNKKGLYALSIPHPIQCYLQRRWAEAICYRVWNQRVGYTAKNYIATLPKDLIEALTNFMVAGFRSS